eukprot:8805432-Lingulodinium_polyedra.AAC.1
MLFSKNAWGVGETTAEGKAMASTVLVKKELAVWYGTPAGRAQTRIDDLSYTMFGTRGEPSRHLHGAETNGFPEFIVSVVLSRVAVPNQE